MLRVLKRLVEVDRRERYYALMAAYYLGASRIEHGLVPLRVILGSSSRPSSGRQPDATFDPGMAAWALEAVSRYVPWRADCLIQAMAGFAWFQRKGYAAKLHLGVARPDDGPLRAHAWLELDGRVILGNMDGSSEAYAPILRKSASTGGEKGRALTAK